MRGYSEPEWAYDTDECPCTEARSADCHIHPTDPDDPREDTND